MPGQRHGEAVLLLLEWHPNAASQLNGMRHRHLEVGSRGGVWSEEGACKGVDNNTINPLILAICHMRPDQDAIPANVHERSV